MRSVKNFFETILIRVKRLSFTPLALIATVCLGVGLVSSFLGCASTANDKKIASDAPQTSTVENPAQALSSAKKDVPDLTLLKIQDLSVREESGQTVLQLKLSKPITRYRHFPLAQPSRIIVDIFGDAKPQTGVQDFRVMTTLIENLRFSYGEGYMRLAADIPGAAIPPYTVTAEDGGLKVVVGTADSKASAKKMLDLVKSGIRAEVRAADLKPASSENQVGVPAQEDIRVQGKRYIGQKLSFDFKDADIKNVFRLLAEVSGLNIVVTDDVNKKVTLRLVEIPWDQALDLLIQTNGLDKEQIGNIVRISTADKLKLERDALAAAKKAEENLEPLQTAYFDINYAKVRDIEPKVKTLLSKRPDASLVVDERSSTIMVRDVKKAVEDVSALIGKLDARTPQVLIESNLIETTPTFARALGVRLQFTSGGTTFSSAAGATPPFLGNSVPFPGDPTGLGGTVSVIQNRFAGLRNLAGALEAAEKEGNIRIISRPSVVTLNNVPSTIRSERILRILLPNSTNIASGSGASASASAVATEKVSVGIILSVTPQVSSDGYVLMNINVKSSSLAANPTSTANSVVPFDELNREAAANVVVKDGETIVIGGILKDTSQDEESGVPYLKDIPVLGWLFKTHHVQKDFEELMVFITPRLTSAGSANLPTAEQLWREQLSKTVPDPPVPPVSAP